MRITRKRLIAGLVPGLTVFAALVGPTAAQASIETGHPEAYENGKLQPEGPAKAVPQVGYGQIHLTSVQLGSEGIECVNLGFGSSWNEPPTATRRALGQILSWVASGHVPEGANTELSASCRPHGEVSKPGSFATDEGFVKSEVNGANEVEPKLRHLSVPWNGELRCGVRAEGTEYAGIVKIGIPTTEFPKALTPCKGSEPTLAEEEEEVAEYKAEREGHAGCYASNPAPAGCIRVTIVEPGAGLEVAYGGTLRAHGLNGTHTGLSATRWKFEGATSGELQCEFPSGCVATGTTTGEVKELGYKEIQLITAK
jgi:hypothetical protein